MHLGIQSLPLAITDKIYGSHHLRQVWTDPSSNVILLWNYIHMHLELSADKNDSSCIRQHVQGLSMSDFLPSMAVAVDLHRFIFAFSASHIGKLLAKLCRRVCVFRLPYEWCLRHCLISGLPYKFDRINVCEHQNTISLPYYRAMLVAGWVSLLLVQIRLLLKNRCRCCRQFGIAHPQPSTHNQKQLTFRKVYEYALSDGRKREHVTGNRCWIVTVSSFTLQVHSKQRPLEDKWRWWRVQTH